MKYFFDTEFLEGTQTKRFCGIPVGRTPPTIDLISIGIVAEDGREYYAISRDFNLEEAWGRYDVKTIWYGRESSTEKVYWIRENVLKPIFVELFIKDYNFNKKMCMESHNLKVIEKKMTYNWLKKLINRHGKSNKQIAEEIKSFCGQDEYLVKSGKSKGSIRNGMDRIPFSIKPEFYAYYADYDWVVFCWLFGNMMNLPKGFPMYCIDLKQIMDEKGYNKYPHLENRVEHIKNNPKYPKQTNEHDALADAKWNYELYKFLQEL